MIITGRLELLSRSLPNFGPGTTIRPPGLRHKKYNDEENTYAKAPGWRCTKTGCDIEEIGK
jgi:hypothetical protein